MTTTLDEIRGGADPKTFPVGRLRKDDTAACFFAAAFLGKNDVIHLHDADISHAILIDNDPARLEEMASLYPKGWLCVLDDAYAVAERYRSSGFLFDVVAVDPWSGGPQLSAFDYNLPLWLSLTKRLLVIGLGAKWFEEKKVPLDLAGLNGWIWKNHWNGGSVTPATALLKRSDYLGGQYWVIFDRSESAA